MNQWLTQYSYRLEPVSYTWMGIILAAYGLAIFSVSFQALTAALKNPTEDLKNNWRY